MRNQDGIPTHGELRHLLDQLIAVRRRELRILRRLRDLLVARDALSRSSALPAEEKKAPEPLQLDVVDVEHLDQALEDALGRAFLPSDAPGPEAGETPTGSEFDPDLLLLRSGEDWVGLPWEQVGSIGLCEDDEGGEPSISLRKLLELEDEADAEPEPYRVTWTRPNGIGAITCEVLGSVVAASAAAARGVELVVQPSSAAGEPACRVKTLVDFLSDGAKAATTIPELITPEVPPRPEVTADSNAEVVDDVAKGPGTPGPPGFPSAPPAAPEFLPEPPPSESIVATPDVVPTPSEPVPGPSEPVPAPSAPMPTPLEPVLLPSEAVETPSELAPSAPETVESPPFGVVETAPRSSRGERVALVAVRYLPARVSVSRLLRAKGWQVHESVDPLEIPLLLMRGPYGAVFAECPDAPDETWLESLRRLQESRVPVISVGSRLRARSYDPLVSLGGVPRMLYPFHEKDLERVLGPGVGATQA